LNLLVKQEGSSLEVVSSDKFYTGNMCYTGTSFSLSRIHRRADDMLPAQRLTTPLIQQCARTRSLALGTEQATYVKLEAVAHFGNLFMSWAIVGSVPCIAAKCALMAT
jgi:hypothetical protein